jgi:hypothetical protein
VNCRGVKRSGFWRCTTKQGVTGVATIGGSTVILVTMADGSGLSDAAHPPPRFGEPRPPYGLNQIGAATRYRAVVRTARATT